MSVKIAELVTGLAQDDPSKWVTHLWSTFNDQRRQKIDEWLELRNYVFATDTSTTSNGRLPWKNSTTLPKLCQIRDNLHSNYLSSLFPNDDWLRWAGYGKKDSSKKKAKAIQAYIGNKCREGHFRTEMSKLLYDYIDYGNAFATVSFESKYKEMADGTVVPDYIGPRVVRISPLDIVFNPLATSFTDSFKIIRSVKTVGELKRLANDEPDQAFWKAAVERREMFRVKYGSYSQEDYDKASGYSVDGFGNMYEYYMGDFVEILEFYGDFHNHDTGELQTNRIITVVDRCHTVRNVEYPSWFGHAPIYHVGWRFRPDNLWAMGPLDNLVGMQYRIDHLENLKADAMDLIVHPPLKIIGEVEEFVWGPGSEIHLDEGGDVQEVSKNLNALVLADNNIQALEDRMELYAGAPREAMGIRTPGEKTALEVQTLSNAAGRIFQEKITTFEIELLERVLNAMLEVARRNMDGSDVIRVMDDDIGVKEFLSITRDDITANGILRPVGARHFAKQAQDLQNVIGIFNSPIGAMVAPHTSGKALTRFVDDVTGLSGYDIFRPNIAISEQQETQALMNQAAEDTEVQASVPTEGALM
ncbi:Bacteriophage head to tail connecting protein [compost metagenome]